MSFLGTEHYREIAQSYVDVPDHINPQMLQHYITALCEHIDYLERELARRNKDFETAHDGMLETLDRLHEAKLELQRKDEALRFYADKENWRVTRTLPSGGWAVGSAAVKDAGERARAVSTPKQGEEEG